MLSPYRAVLAQPGAKAFSGIGVIARLPISMIGIGVVLLVAGQTGSYTQAGAVSATFVLTNACFAIVQGRLIDRFGQRRVLVPAILTFGAALATLMVSVTNDGPAVLTYAAAAVTGAALPSVGSCVRARWSYVLSSPRQVQTAYAWEAVADESVFISGPTLVAMLATGVHPLAGLLLALLAGVGGTLAFAGLRVTEPPVRSSLTVGVRPPMPWSTVIPLVVVMVGLGGLFGGAEVATVAFATERDAEGYSGLLLGIWATGSLLAGFITGAISWRAGSGRRLANGAIGMTTAMLPLSWIDPVWAMGVFLFVGGFAVSPTMIPSMTLTEEVVPASRLTEGMGIMHTGLAAGVAAGAAIAGVVVDEYGGSAAYWVPFGCGLVAAITAQLLRRRGAPVRRQGSEPARGTPPPEREGPGLLA